MKNALLIIGISAIAIAASVSASVELELYWDTGDIGIVEDIEVADVDMDGIAETIVPVELGYGQTSPVLIYNGESKTIEHAIWLPSGHPTHVEVADIDGDGIPELIVGSSTIWEQGQQGYIYIYNGTTYELEWESENIGGVWSMHVADIDCDGVKEIFAGIPNAPVQQDYGRILILDGITHATEFDTTFAPHFIFTWLSSVSNLDGDPALEIVFGDFDQFVSDSGNVYVMDGLSHTVERKWGSSGSFRGSTSGDIDGDGRLEIIISHSTGPYETDVKQILVFNLDWDLEWLFDFPPLFGVGPGPLALGDVDGDQVPEIVVGMHLGAWPGYFLILDGQTQSEVWTRDLLNIVHALTFGDVNNDGRADLCVGYHAGWNSGRLEVYEVVGFGAICGNVTLHDSSPVENITVKVVDQFNNQASEPIITNSDGSFYFDSLLVGTYSVMIVTPLGYLATPAETQTEIQVTGYPCTEINFILEPTITYNNSRTIGYWKHQFDVYIGGRGNAQEDFADLDAYLDLVHQHFNVLGVYVDLENSDFEDAKNILTVRGGSLMIDRAKQQLFSLLLNFASGRIGNETVVSDDGQVAAEAVTLAANLINDENLDNDELAKTICDLINNGQMVDGGVIPESPIRYKFEPEYMPHTFSMGQNFPNPFNAQTTIEYGLPKTSHVEIEIYDLLGRKVETLIEGLQQPGNHHAVWNASNETSGIYFVRFTAGQFSETMKIILLK